MRAIGIWLGLALLGLGPVAQAATPWEVAVLFLGSGEPAEFQADVDQNILELARVVPGPLLRLSIYREFADRAVEFRPDPASETHTAWDPLFQTSPMAGVPAYGDFRVTARDGDSQTLLKTQDLLPAFFVRVFQNPAARRVLIVYGHGLGTSGLQAIKLKPLRRQLEKHLVARAGRKPLDLLWLDACFMATLEVSYELRGLSDLLLASEEAEFSAGAPFESLNRLTEGPDDARSVAVQLAEAFLDSYSYLKQGSQRRAAYSSSATLSVIATDRIDALVTQVAALRRSIGSLTDEQRASLRRAATRQTMDRQELIDFGSFLLALRRQRSLSAETRGLVDGMLASLELSKRGRLKTNVRIPLLAPQENALLTYGYEEWQRGFQGDKDVSDKVPANLRPTTFIAAGDGRAWPARVVRKRLYASPFTVGLNRFDTLFLDPESQRQLGPPESFARTQDSVRFATEVEANPILFMGYTQGIGAAAERYSGFAILDPTQRAAGLDYIETEFSARTGWGNL